MKKIACVVGARPNFMKMAPVISSLQSVPDLETHLVHTGQHYDELMSKVFFRDLKMPPPRFDLEVGSASHGVQTGEIIRKFEAVCEKLRPDFVLVAGDVNSTLACALAAVKLHIPIGHVESGLRSFDRTMPEEINRVLTDQISDLLFTTEESANQNLVREGIERSRIFFVGNTMIDSLRRLIDETHNSRPHESELSMIDTDYLVATVHRPSNVDDDAQLSKVLEVLEKAAALAPVLFIVHPRTVRRIEPFKGSGRLMEWQPGTKTLERQRVYLLPPSPYPEFVLLVSRSRAVLTDSGGIQEESTVLGIPCLTLRENTERPVTVEIGTNEIVGLNSRRIVECLELIMGSRWKKGTIPPLWDGKAADRIVSVLAGQIGIPTGEVRVSQA